MEDLKELRSNHDKVLLVILDGVGHSAKSAEYGNAVARASLPVLSGLWNNFPTVDLLAHGKAVGMPSDEDMGNSEVGHNVLGCGRVYDQGAKLVSGSIAEGLMFKGKAWNELRDNCIHNSSVLHFIGLLSDGNIHSNIEHLFAMIRKAKEEKVGKVRVHILLDGRDVPETSALLYIDRLDMLIDELRSDSFDIKTASGGGRMVVTMDRYEADWSVVETGWKAHVLGEGKSYASAKSAVESLRLEHPGVTDQYLPPFVVAEDGKPVGTVENNDSVIFFNFRGDRAIEISRAFTEKEFSVFDRKRFPEVMFAGMMQYDGDLKIPARYLVEPPAISQTMSEYLARAGVSQYAISETQKFGHVTYFWNGNRSGYFNKDLETFVEIPSDRIAFDQKPLMKAAEITDALVDAMKSGKYDFLRVNYANGDMVGHTGNMDATVASLEFLDKCVQRLLAAADETGIAVLVTADHGNSDEMYELSKNGELVKGSDGKPRPKTSHTLNPVFLSLYDPKKRWALQQFPDAGLANVAATVMEMIGYQPPADYRKSLLQNL